MTPPRCAVIAAALLSLCTYLPIHAAVSGSIDLGGTWATIGLDEPAWPPTNAPGWTDVDVIAPVGARPWLVQRRTFDIPAQMQGQRLFLRFEGVKYTAMVRCNGARVGEHKGGYEPFECDITDVARVGGANSVQVLVGSWKQLTTDPAAVADYPLGRDGIEMATDQILYPIGSHGSMGIWAPVSLEARPDVYIEDVYIIPSFRRKSLTVRATIRNLSEADASVTVGHTALREGSALLKLQDAYARVEANSSTVVETRQDWPNPPLWWPHDPVLLELRTQLATDDEVSDRSTERFGFREFWADKSMFVLNGIPLHMRGSSCHPRGYTRGSAEQTYRICREGNINAFRLHAQPWGKAYYDVADETGMMIMHETAVWCHARSYALADDRFWQNFSEHIRAQIKLHRNRPSLFAWSLENELLHVGGARVPETESRLAGLATVAREIDASRMVNYDGDEDPEGAADIINLHYPHRFPRNRDWPTTCWWLDDEKVVEGWPRTEWLWARNKPLYIGEYLWQPSSVPDPYALFHGDEAYTDVNRYRYAAKASSWRYQIEAYRAQGLSGGCPWNVFEGGRLPESPMYQASKLAYRPQCAIIKQWDTTFRPGQQVTREVTFINDVLRPAELKASWFCVLDGEVSSRGDMALQMQPAQIRHETVRLTVPLTDERKLFDMVFTLEEGDREVFRETRPCSVVPVAPPASADPGAIAVYDPSGETARVLERLGVQATPAQQAWQAPAGVRCLLIGANAFTPPAEVAAPVIGTGREEGGAARSFVEGGGRLIVLAQKYLPQWLPASLMQDGSTIAFVRSPGHPLVAGCKPADFSLWGPDHLVSHRDIARPERGAGKVIVDAGGEGLNRALLLEVRAGKGAYLFCQLPLVEKYEACPIAAQTLHRLLDQGLGEAPGPLKPLAVMSDDRALTGMLAGLGVAMAAPASTWQNVAGLLVDGDQQAMVRDRQDLGKVVAAGKLLWMHNPSEQFLDEMGLAREAVVWEQRGAAPLRATGAPPLADGMRNEDLYWLADEAPRRHANWTLTPDITNHILSPRLAPGAGTQIGADGFDNSTVKITRRAPEGIWLSTRGTVTAQLTIPKADAYVIGVLAGGTPMAGVYPAYTVQVGDVSVGGFMAKGSEPSWHTVSGRLPAGTHELRVSFVNDQANPPLEDRNGLIAGARIAAAMPWPVDVTPLTEPVALYCIAHGAGYYLIDGINWQQPGPNANKAIRLLNTLLVNAGVQMDSVSAGVAVPLGGFELDPEAVHVRNDSRGVYLGDTAWAQGEVSFAADGRYAIILQAQGTQADGEFPEIELSIDGQVIDAKHLVSAGWQDVVFEANVKTGAHIIRFRFTNDLYDPAMHFDRNLWVRRMSIAAAGE